ncbi:hypothetical protein EVAR_28657_1 [Eumeta japonica]|uniref:Uncharacterized protein n=1 Tax=Eumeta variegata TaxID=151549 RepID=A0A4C2ACQ2_EUMVA|nr:hypothetical protein EVAR_28657_1 [Eumeta japonica]
MRAAQRVLRSRAYPTTGRVGDRALLQGRTFTTKQTHYEGDGPNNRYDSYVYSILDSHSLALEEVLYKLQKDFDFTTRTGVDRKKYLRVCERV